VWAAVFTDGDRMGSRHGQFTRGSFNSYILASPQIKNIRTKYAECEYNSKESGVGRQIEEDEDSNKIVGKIYVEGSKWKERMENEDIENWEVMNGNDVDEESDHKEESEVEREESSSDEGVSFSPVTLNYSREDIQVLAQQAELMVLGKIEANLDDGEENEKEKLDEEDSDYSSHLLLSSSLVSSEPNLQLRSSPHRRTLHRRQTHWRNSLPSCLEFYREITPGSVSRLPQASVSKNSVFTDTDTDPEVKDRVSAPELSELWESEQCVSEGGTWDGDRRHDLDTSGGLLTLLTWGEDYTTFLGRPGLPGEEGSSTDTGEENRTERGRNECKGGQRTRAVNRRHRQKNKRSIKDRINLEECQNGQGEQNATKHEMKSSLQKMRKKLMKIVNILDHFGKDLDDCRDEKSQDNVSLVCDVKHEVTQVKKEWEKTSSHTSSPVPCNSWDQRRRWCSWSFAFSLLLLFLFFLGFLTLCCLQPQCCSDHILPWSYLSNPIRLTYRHGPPPI